MVHDVSQRAGGDAVSSVSKAGSQPSVPFQLRRDPAMNAHDPTQASATAATPPARSAVQRRWIVTTGRISQTIKGAEERRPRLSSVLRPPMRCSR
jgi:hypothetical protein